MTPRIAPVALALLAVVAVTSGCGDDSASGTPTSTLPPVTAPPTTAPDPDGSWRVVSGTVGGAPVTLVDGHDITLDVDGDEIGGTSACNQYGGTATIDAGSIAVGEVSATEMACTEAGVMELEQAYLASLTGEGTYAVDGDTLTLTMGDAVWVFEAA